MPPIYYSLKKITQILRQTDYTKSIIVTSPVLSKKLSWAIKEIGTKEIVLVPDGEKAKTWNKLEKLLKKFSDLALDRKSLVVILGGGTVGDMVGFACSIYLRGIRYIQIPTTLVAQVDSAHGGKTGINFGGYKNQIGSFYPPTAIIIDHRFLQSLTRAQINDGLGEIIKYGFIKDPSILDDLEKSKIDWYSVVQKSIRVKNYFVQRDFKDNNLRQALNVGHTIGHALELKYGLSHGTAVICGMIREFQITEKMYLTKSGVSVRLGNIVHHLNISIPKDIKADPLTIRHDKKVLGDSIEFPVVTSVGKVMVKKMKLSKLDTYAHL